MRPTTSHEFDQAYQRPFTVWGDFRVPTEIADLIRHGQPQRVFELGCGVGRFSRYVAKQGVRVTGVDFSSVAIGKARARVAADATPPRILGRGRDQVGAGRGPLRLWLRCRLLSLFG